MDPKLDAEEPHVTATNLYFEMLLTVGTLIFGVALDQGLIAAPRSVDVLAADVSFSRRVVPDALQLANSTAVAALAGVLTPALIFAVDACGRRSRVGRTLRRVIGYGVGAALVLTTCAAMRLSSGIPAPDFLARCGAPLNATRVSENLCSHAVPVSTLASFPSTNAALAMYSTALCALYLFCHVPTGESTVSIILQAAPVIGGLAAALAQVGGARAHASDAAWGIVVGLIIAAFVQARFFGGLARSYHGEDATELAEFLHAHTTAHSTAVNDELKQRQRTQALLSTATVPSTLPLPLRALPTHFNAMQQETRVATTATPRKDAALPDAPVLTSPIERAKAMIRVMTAEGLLKP